MITINNQDFDYLALKASLLSVTDEKKTLDTIIELDKSMQLFRDGSEVIHYSSEDFIIKVAETLDTIDKDDAKKYRDKYQNINYSDFICPLRADNTEYKECEVCT